MKKQNYLIVTLSLFLLLITGLAAFGHGWFGTGIDEFDIDAAVNRIASRLYLTAPQRTELREIATDIAERAKEMRGSRGEQHRELADLIRRETIERETADRMIAERLDKMQELADFALPRLIEFHAGLTPEQRERTAGLIEERVEKRGWFRRWFG